MAGLQRNSSLRVEVVPAPPEQEPLLANLFELYAHDFSEFVALELGADGRFGFAQLPSYWTEPGRHPFLVRVNGHPAGFVLVWKGSQVSGDAEVWDVAEFFVIRRYRRLGVGTAAAHAVWRRLPGRWEVRVLDQNQRAQAFWARAVGEFTGDAAAPKVVDSEGVRWHVFSFESEAGD